MEDLLTCPICGDLLSTAMMLPLCSHNFCSLCIRKWLDVKQQCPVCKKNSESCTIYNNRAIDEMVKIFKEEISNDSPLDQSKPIGSLKMNKSPQKIESESHKDKRKYLPKLAYHLLNEKSLRKALTDHNLSTKGKREDLIWRHKEFVIRYNANLDSVNPVHVNCIIEELESVEKDVRKHKVELDVSQTGISKFFKTSINNSASLESPIQKRKSDPIKDAVRAYKRLKVSKMEEIKEMLKDTVQIQPEPEESSSKEQFELLDSECASKSAENHSISVSDSSISNISQNHERSQPSPVQTPPDLSKYQCSQFCTWVTAWNAKYGRPFHFNRIQNSGTFYNPDHSICKSQLR